MFRGSTGFRALPSAPTVTGVSPSSGGASGGTSVTITGTNFAGMSQVSFGGTPATSFKVNTAQSVTATSPSESVGTVDVQVTTPIGTSPTSIADQFTFTAVTPTVTSVSPTTGPTTGGTVVAVGGTNFSGATAVKFGATAASSFTVNSSISISATSPAESAGTVDITVTNISGTSGTGSADQFTFTAPASGADFSTGMGGDFSVSYVNLYDATTLLIGTDDGSNVSSGGIITAYFGQAGSTLPNFSATPTQLTFNGGSASATFSVGAVFTSDTITLPQTFNPAVNYVCSFYLTNGINYRVVISASALLTAATLTNQVRVEFRWGSVNGLSQTFIAGGVTTYNDGGTAGSNQSNAITPTGTYTSIASELLLLEKIAVVP